MATNSTFVTPNTGNPADITATADITALSSGTPKGSLTPKPTLPTDTAPVNQMLSYTDIITQSQNDLAKSSAAQNETAIDSAVRKYLGLDGGTSIADQKQAETNAINQQYDVSGTSAKLAQLKAQIEANKLSAEGQKQSVGQNTGGLTNADIAGFWEQIDRRTASKNLALASEGFVLQGNLAAAEAAIKSSVDAKYAPIEERYKAILEYNKLNETRLGREAEKQQQRAQAKLKELEEKKKNEEEVGKMIAEAIPNAPASVIANAKKIAEKGGSKVEVGQALGIYGGDYLANQIKKAQLTKLGLENKKAIQELYDNPSGLKTLSYEENAKFNSTPQVKAINDANKYAMAIQNYKDAIEKYGTGEVMGTGSGALGQAYSAVVGAVKDYYNLGTLDNGVQKLVDLGIPAPSVWGQKSARVGALDEALGEASKTLKTNIDQLSSTRYKNTNEFKNLVDTSSSVLMARMTNEELLASMPGASNSTNDNTSTNQTFFSK